MNNAACPLDAPTARRCEAVQPRKAAPIQVKPCTVKEIREFVETHHYSHNINGVKISQCFAVTFESELCGAVIFGELSTTAWKRFSKSEKCVLELRRLVLLDKCPKNSESHVISKSIKWIKNNMKNIEVIVSYADPMYGHSGTIYKAANFLEDGKTPKDTGYKDKDTGKIYHSRALRTRNADGSYKPFVKILREKNDAGLLDKIVLEGKYRFVYYLHKTWKEKRNARKLLEGK
jgi:hypothetical protein